MVLLLMLLLFLLLVLLFIHSFIPDIYITPLQETYSEALSVQLRPKRYVLRSLQKEDTLFLGNNPTWKLLLAIEEQSELVLLSGFLVLWSTQHMSPTRKRVYRCTCTLHTPMSEASQANRLRLIGTMASYKGDQDYPRALRTMIPGPLRNWKWPPGKDKPSAFLPKMDKNSGRSIH